MTMFGAYTFIYNLFLYIKFCIIINFITNSHHTLSELDIVNFDKITFIV